MWFSFHFAGLSLLGYSQTHLPLIHVKPCFTGDVLNICTRARAKILVWPWKHRCKHKLKPKNKDKILLACVLVSVLLHNTLTLHSLNNIQLWKSWLSTLRGNRTWQQANPTNFQRMGGWASLPYSFALICEWVETEYFATTYCRPQGPLSPSLGISCVPWALACLLGF